jgi:cardiolipin synthase
MIEILVTGEELLGRGIRSIGTVINELIGAARDEIHIAAYLITSPDFIDLLVRAACRGVKVYILLNSLEEQPAAVREKLFEATKNYRHFAVKEFCKINKGTLHAKTVVVDRSRAIVGSANFTRAGMTAGNYEIAVFITGKEAAIIAKLIESL